MAGAGPLTAGRAGRAHRRRPSATCASGSPPRRPAATSPTTPTATRYNLPPEQAMALADEDGPAFMLGGFQLASAVLADEPKLAEAFRDRRGRRLARARPPAVRGHRALLPPGLPRQPGRARGSRRSTGSRPSSSAGAQGRRRRLRPRRLDPDHGRGVPAARPSSAPTTTTPRSRRPAGAPRRAGVGRPGRASRSPARKDYSGRRLRPRLLLRLPARHGRSGRARSRHVRETLADDGTVMLVEPFAGDRGRGQPQPGRPRLLLRLDDALHARLARPGGRARARRPGGRGASGRGRRRGRLHAGPRATETPLNLVLELRP